MPSKAISDVQLGIYNGGTKRICGNTDTQYSWRSEIDCDIFHLFVNASLARHSLKRTVASSSMG